MEEKQLADAFSNALSKLGEADLSFQSWNIVCDLLILYQSIKYPVLTPSTSLPVINRSILVIPPRDFTTTINFQDISNPQNLDIDVRLLVDPIKLVKDMGLKIQNTQDDPEIYEITVKCMVDYNHNKLYHMRGELTKPFVFPDYVMKLILKNVAQSIDNMSIPSKFSTYEQYGECNLVMFEFACPLYMIDTD